MNNKICRLTGFILYGIAFTMFLLLTIFTTCSLEGDIEAKRPKPVEIPPPDDPNKSALIVFDNTQGICTVSVYKDYRRWEEDKIAVIPAGNSSGEIAWMSGASVPFYFSYAVTFKDINGFTLNYVPEIGKDQKTVRIDANVTTTIKVPTLSETFSSPDTLLSNNSYLFIQNNSSYSFELHQGTSKLKPDNFSSFLVNNGEKAQYTINPGPASNYRLLVGADYKEFSGSIVNFDAGHIYIFAYNGSISLVSNTELKLENVNGFAIPQPPAAPVVITSNGSITLQWTAVESATAYEIWMATVNNSASASKYGADVATSLSTTISGLNNGTTYYFWLKAKNSLGTSGFSPVASGTPTASTVKPPDPQTAPSIIAGNGQLAVSWQAVDQADVYEIWAWTTNNSQTAIKRGEDVSGLSTVITGLNNGTTYYVWIKAKNNIGVSGFSPYATGKPLGTPGTPTVNSAYKGLLVTWTAVAGADQYEVYYGIDTPTILAETTIGTTATISGLTAGTTYHVRLRAKNANGFSDFGPSASGVTNDNLTPGLYRKNVRIGQMDIASSLSFISTNAESGDEYYIVLGANESITSKILNYSGKKINITLMGYDSERTITHKGGSMFTVNSGVTLILEENITLVGRSSNSDSLVIISGGKLVMNNGSNITGNNNSSSSSNNNYNGGGIYITSNGDFTMNGGQISGNSIIYGGNNGGGIYVNNGTFTMNNGEISGNTSRTGSGVYVNGNGTFIMNNGKISGNGNTFNNGVGVGAGAGVYIIGNFTMNGGEISSNTAYGNGGGVYVEGTFNMNGGKISNNTTFISGFDSQNPRYGGGVFVNSNGTFTKSGSSTITGYASDAINGNVVKNDSGVAQSNRGHAVYVDTYPIRRRETTAGPGINLDSRKSGTGGGWEN